MNCAEFQEIVHDIGRDADLNPDKRWAALAHADLCPRCDELLAQSQSLVTALRTLAAKDSVAEAGLRVEEALLDAFRQRQREIGAVRPMRKLQRGIAAFAALAALILLSVFGLRHLVVSPPTHGSGAGTSAATQPATGAAGSTQPPAASGTNSNASETEYADSFVNLPFTDEAAGDEIIVRQSVSRSMLANYGLPVSEAGENETVVADFVVDEDGTPRAVRIVQ
jgi:hypothetical protein